MSKPRLRISVNFGETKLLVPCGDGSITIEGLIEKAIERYKKNKKMHQDDQIVVEGLYQEDRSACYEEDEVIEILDDKETVNLVYKIIPHDAGPDYEPVLINAHLLAPTPPPPPLPSIEEQVVVPTAELIPISTHNSPPHPPPAHPSHATPTIPSHATSSLIGVNKTGGGANPYLPPSPFSPLPSDYDGGTVYPSTGGHEFLTTPTNLFSSQEDLLGSSNPAEPSRTPNDFINQEEVGGTATGDLGNDTSNLSQVVMGIGTEFPEEHNESQVGMHSQVSVNSISTTPPNYDMDLMPSGESGYSSRLKGSFNSRSSSQMDPKSSAHPFNLSIQQQYQQQQQQPQRYGSFSTSQSMERINMPHRSSGMYEHAPSQEPYYFEPPGGTSYMNVMASQPESGAGWPVHTMYPPLPHMRFMGGANRPGAPYYMHSAHHRGQYMGGRGTDPYDRYPEADFHQGGYPMHPGYGDMIDRRSKRSSVGGMPMDYDETVGGRGRYQPPPRWGMSKDDDYSMSRRSEEEQSLIDYNLSQPASYSASRYSHHLAPPNVQPYHMNRPISGPSGVSLSQPGTIGVYRKKSALKNRNEQSPRADNKMKLDDGANFSIDEELYEEDEDQPSPFQRSKSKSMILDDRWGEWQMKMENIDSKGSDVPQYDHDDNDDDQEPNGNDGEEDVWSQPPDHTDKDEIGGNDIDDDVHVVELLRGEEPLGIQLVSYNSEGRDLGVFIGALNKNGFAAKSGKLKVNDQILACNGEDFTRESNERVEERFHEMAEREPLLRIAISRDFNFKSLKNDEHSQENPVPPVEGAKTNNPSGETASPSNPISTTLTNTRQIGVKHVIVIPRSSKNGTFGFGLSSRDVFTNEEDHPIYIKSITSDGPAFQDGRLKLGDRLLEVNDESVKGFLQSEVVRLLRLSGSSVKLVISRQEVVESQQDEFLDSSESPIVSSSTNKTVMAFDIHLDNGLAGLGVTVHGRCSSSKRQQSSDMGIYIKSIVPGGAAAKDGRLKINDQLISVNSQSVTNMSNREAMEALKKELRQAEPNIKISSIKLTIARTSGPSNRKHQSGGGSYTSQMPALQEEERPPPDGGQTNEIGIDCPDDVKVSAVLSQELDLGESFDNQSGAIHDELMLSRSSNGSLSSSNGGCRFDSSLEYSGSYYQPMTTAGSSTAPNNYELEVGGGGGGARGSEYVPETSHSRSGPSSQIKMAGGGNSYSPKGLPRAEYSYRENSLDRALLKKKQPLGQKLSGGWLSTGGGGGGEGNESLHKLRHNSPMRQESLSPTNERSPWSAMPGPDHSKHSTSSSSLSPYPRSASVHSELSASGSFKSHHISHHTLSFSPHDNSKYSSSGNLSSSQRSSRDSSNSFRRIASPPYDTLKPAGKGSNRNADHHIESHTLPRMTNSGRYTINERDPNSYNDRTSLTSFSSDTDIGNFQRDDAARRSIPKNSAKPQPNLKHVPLANVVPLVDGEGSPSPPLYRVGSDSDITAAFSNYNNQSGMLDGVEVGPNLRMVKSSSLESLQTVMHHTINADARGLRSRGSTRNSFRRAVDRSYADEHNADSNTVISLTKSPKKKMSRKSLIDILKPKKSSKAKKVKKSRSRTMSSIDIDLSEDSIDNLAKEFGISMDTIKRMQSHSGKLDGDDERGAAAIEKERRRTMAIERRDDHLFASHNTRAL